MKKSHYIIGGVVLSIGLAYLFVPNIWNGGNNYTRLMNKYKTRGTHAVLNGKSVTYVSNSIPQKQVSIIIPTDSSKQPIKITK
jgi:hypothetical protein